MAKLITSRIQHPVHTAAALKTKHPVLLKGEIVYESDTTLHKVGDGKTPWNNLPYVGGGNRPIPFRRRIFSKAAADGS